MVRTALLLLIAIATSSCTPDRRIVVASKNFTEQVVIGEILAQQIERALQVPVERKLNLGGTLLAHEALKNGSIDLYPEYTGTALTAVLKHSPSNDPKAVLEDVRSGYRQWGLVWLDPFGFDNTFAMVVRSETANRQQVRTLSDAARRSEPWRLGAGYEFTQRADGLAGLARTYGLKLKGEVTTMDLGLLYPALRSGKIDMAAANATDAHLADAEFTALVDDRGYFPPYECAIVVREDVLAGYPGLREVLEQLSGSISGTEMRRMNAEVDRKHRSVPDVAKEFLDGFAARHRSQRTIEPGG